MKGFGESAVNLELRIWIDDPRKGVSNVKSEVFLRLWDKFREHGIEIPFPQRDLHLRTPPELSLAMRRVVATSPAAGARLEPAKP
jgi:small-conductance mechanosensitive channel